MSGNFGADLYWRRGGPEDGSEELFSVLACVSCSRFTYSPVHFSVLVHSANSAGEPGTLERPDMASQIPGLSSCENWFSVETNKLVSVIWASLRFSCCAALNQCEKQNIAVRLA